MIWFFLPYFFKAKNILCDTTVYSFISVEWACVPSLPVPDPAQLAASQLSAESFAAISMTAILPSLLLQFISLYFELRSYEISHFKDWEKSFLDITERWGLPKFDWLSKLTEVLAAIYCKWWQFFNRLSKSAKSLTFRGCEVNIKITGVNVSVKLVFVWRIFTR